jgi:hypothetical protein
LPTEQFELEIPFFGTLDPKSSLFHHSENHHPLSSHDPREAGFLLMDFRFWTAKPLDATGFDVTEEDADGMLTILSDGWSGLETKLGHVWSVAKTANVRLMTRDVPGTLTIGLKANPFVPDGRRWTLPSTGKWSPRAMWMTTMFPRFSRCR